MKKNRIEAFSDGVLAIIITIMVLELKVPEGDGLSALLPLWPVFLSYVISFVHVGIYWNNHHHMFQRVEQVGGGVLWANLNLLFWLSLMPFATAFMGENHFASLPVAVYVFDLLMCGASYALLEAALLASHGAGTALRRSLRRRWKEGAAVVLYLVALALAFVSAPLALGSAVAVAAIWFIPDRRFERAV